MRILSMKSSGDGTKINNSTSIREWSVKDVCTWTQELGCCSEILQTCLQAEQIDGLVLLDLSDDDIRDFRYRLDYTISFGEIKKFCHAVHDLQHNYWKENLQNGTVNKNSIITPMTHQQSFNGSPIHRIHGQPIIVPHIVSGLPACSCTTTIHATETSLPIATTNATGNATENYNVTPPSSVDGRATNIPPEFFKTGISLGYSFLVTWITSFVMVIVHERVPDMKRYPPLPDIFLDNVPHIPWAFHMCEITGTLLFTIWTCVCVFHKYRMVLLRRFFALAGTVFLLRCVTMLITSLSVPGTHLQCNQADYPVDDSGLSVLEALVVRISRAYTIWSGLGMSIQGVRTCGDYMFSGHTVALTLLNFFITEYTPRHLYFLHTMTWLLNMFGIFFILAAHEHYSIDVFVAFYITSRLFLYYHTLANNQALMSNDSNRTRIWFPMFSYFESSVEGIVPNEFDTVSSLIDNLFVCIINVKDSFMLTARRFWIQHHPHLAQLKTKHLIYLQTGNVADTATKLRTQATDPARDSASSNGTNLKYRNSKASKQVEKINNTNCTRTSTYSNVEKDLKANIPD